MPWTGPHTISVGSIRASHTVEKGRRTPKRFLAQPIYVKKGLFGYRIHDGNHRLALAKAAGRHTIRAYIWK